MRPWLRTALGPKGGGLHRRLLLLAGAALVLALSLSSEHSSRAQAPGAVDRFRLEPNQRVFFIGNTFAERMAIGGYFEAVMHAAHPEHRLVARNLGWSADEVDLQPRPANFGTMLEHLDWNDADVVFLCFGMNESFGGDAGLERWRERLSTYLDSLIGQTFHREPVRLVLVSPIAHEDLGAPLPTGPQVVERNRLLALYSDVMRVVAAEKKVRFIDLFTPTHAFTTAQSEVRLTRNGIHLTETGDYHVSRWMAESLGWVTSADADAAMAEAKVLPEAPSELLRSAIIERNHHFLLLWRPLSSFYIWGGRAYCWKADEPMVELERVAMMVENRDRVVWERSAIQPADVWRAAPGQTARWEAPIDYTDRTDPSVTPPQLEMVRRNGVIK